MLFPHPIHFAPAISTLYFAFRIRIFLRHEITTIAMAAYTSVSLMLAIINVIRYRKYGSPAYYAAKNRSLVSATVSVLTLGNALLTAFGAGESELFRQVMLGISGTAVILVVQESALYMIVEAKQKLRMNAGVSVIASFCFKVFLYV